MCCHQPIQFAPSWIWASGFFAGDIRRTPAGLRSVVGNLENRSVELPRLGPPASSVTEPGSTLLPRLQSNSSTLVRHGNVWCTSMELIVTACEMTSAVTDLTE